MENPDIDLILSHRHDNGADYWATSDGRIYVGNPYSTIGSLAMLHELGLDSTHEAVAGGIQLILEAWREDGRFQLAPRAPLYPCYSAEAARVLCRFSLTESEEVGRTISYLLDNMHDTGGWRCNFSRFGKGPETEYANPGATLYVLDCMRFFPELREGDRRIDSAISFLLDHWDSREPLGPCHWGIGTQFMKVEFPFIRYNVFYYVYVLSFFEKAKSDDRFRAAFEKLSTKQDANEMLMVESPHRSLKGLQFCAKGKPSMIATKRYREIQRNLGD